MSTPIVGLIMGIIFGASLVLAGLTDPDKIIGSLRLKDFHALRTIVVFVLVGLLGTWLLGFVGAANLKIESAVIPALLLGGALVGIGIGLSGYCPGTGLAAFASGRIDALFTVLGMLFGAHVYVLIYPAVVVPLEKIANFGPVTLPQITGTSASSWIVPVFITGAAVLIVTRRGKDTIDEGKTHEERTVSVAAPSHPSIPFSPAFATSCMEALRMFCNWKNFLFTIIVLCLLVLQGSFWLVKAGYVGIENDTYENISAADGDQTQKNDSSGQITGDLTETTAAKIEVPMKLPWKPHLVAFDINFERIALLLKVSNAVLVLASLLYVLAILFGLTISLAGRFGGLNHICTASYLSLMLLLLLLPWRASLGSFASGAIYTPGELANLAVTNPGSTFEQALIYLRFTGFWIMASAVLILVQLRSSRWSKTAVRKLKYTILMNSSTSTENIQESDGF